MTPRPLLSEDARTTVAAEKVAGFNQAIVQEVANTVQRDAVVVVGMATNPFVKKARQALTDNGIEFTFLSYGGYTSKWKERLAIKMWSGWPTFPQVFVRGTLIGGFDETQAALADGSLKQRLSG